ncbi:MAG: DUF2786 domain-containing protein [Actinoplanes sp.]
MARNHASIIRALLARADHPNTPVHEAEAAREKAEELMREYRVAEEEALATDPTSATPTHVVIDIVLHQASQVAHSYPQMVRELARHCEIRVAVQPLGYGYRVTAVGYEGDLRYFEFLWTSTQLMFATKIDPHWSAERSEAENIYLMRQAGIKRYDIADAAWGRGAGAEAKNRSKVQRTYLKEVQKRGEDALAKGLGFNSSNYREAYAEAFVTTLRRRLREARDAANSKAGLPVHHGRADRVDEAFYTLFPSSRPTDVEPAAEWVDPRKACLKKACQEGRYCHDHSYLRPRAVSQRELIAYENRMHGASARAGRMSGATAAGGVVISRGHTTENRIERETRAVEG